MEYTSEQQAVISAKGRIIVSASAGSGKTAVMIKKMIDLIVDGTDISSVLAVTFTKKAAAQMKEKLKKALVAKINDEETTEEQKKHLKKQPL